MVDQRRRGAEAASGLGEGSGGTDTEDLPHVTVPLVCALFTGVVDEDDEPVREGRCRTTPNPDSDGPARLFAEDGDAVVGAVVVGPALDPGNLAAE